MTREDLIEKYVSAHAECRWMDAGDLDDLLHSFVRELDLLKLPEDLEEAKEAYCNEHNDDCFDATGDTCPHIRKAFIAGAEWQKAKMMKEAVEGEIQMRYSGCLCAKTIRAINEDKFKLGDKVRVIIVKED